ncbi:hypothetical protein [Xanthomonas sp. NCPPB 2632]|jgi:hypothetical protein|uniref:hypothetical protein n=1 Tax=Xanthomonas sp. NCPPB 2632 TaxID=3240912 RepID=UPI00351724D4
MRCFLAPFALLAGLTASGAGLAASSNDIPREKGLLRFIDRDGNLVGIPEKGNGPLHLTTQLKDTANARMPGPSAKGPVINQQGRCLTLLSPFKIQWATCELGANKQLWTRHAGGLQGSAPYAGQIDADSRVANGKLHIVRGEHGLTFANPDSFGPAND